MARSILVVMLMATQLLAGSGGPVYLCIRSDGSFCCLDAGPGSCGCCEVEAPDRKKSSGCSCCHHDSAPVCESTADRKCSADLVGVIVGHCDCTHVLLVQENSSARVVRASGSVERIGPMGLAVDPSSTSIAEEMGRPWAGRSEPFRPPTTTPHTLTVLSCVLIQC